MIYENYAHQCLAGAGFAVMNSQIAHKLRPDLWASGQGCALDMRPMCIRGTHRLSVRLEGLDAPALVIARSVDDLARRIEWVTGHRVIDIAEYQEQPQPVATIGPDPEAYRQARIDTLRKLAAQELPAHECALRKDILEARGELERLAA